MILKQCQGERHRQKIVTAYAPIPALWWKVEVHGVLMEVRMKRS